MVGWIDDEWGNHSRLPSSTLTGFFFNYMNKIELNKIYLKREFMLYFVFYTMMNEFELYIYIYIYIYILDDLPIILMPENQLKIN
jgi:hypothetical protein